MLRVFLDVDGVLADFVGGTCKLYDHTPEIVTIYDYWHLLGLSSEQVWDGITATGGGFWSGLDAYPWCHDLKEYCDSFANTTLLTAPPKARRHHQSMLMGRTDWIHNKFGDNFTRYFVGAHKEEMAGPNSLLIDDMQANCEKWVAAGGHAVLFPQQWNSNADKTGDMSYVKEAIAELVDEIGRNPFKPGRLL